MHTWAEIWALMQDRRRRQGPLLNQMREVRNRYNGDWVVPYLTVEDMPELPPLTPALIAETVDNLGMRAGSVLPAIFCPAIDPAKQTGRKSLAYARTRRKIITATYAQSKMQLQLRKAYRHLTGYATCAMVVIPDYKRNMPVIRIRDPLATFPDPKAGEDFEAMENVGFIFAKSASWIRKCYPEAKIPATAQGEEMWEMVEWIDAEHIVIGLLGPAPSGHQYNRDPTQSFSSMSGELRRWPNRVGRVTAISAGRITLDRVASQLSHVTGITDLMARMMALDIMAKEKSIFPDRYILGRSGMNPQLVGSEWKDGRTGEMNVILDAESIGALSFSPDPASSQAIDRLERNARVSSGLVPQFGGETYGALRTGRGIDALMGAAVDPRIQEMQEIMQAWLPDLNEIILETWRAYWPDEDQVLTSGWPLDHGEVRFNPSTHIETLANTVSYPIAGADVSGTNIILGQMLGAETISRRTFRERHPWIGDAAEEAARVDEETFERAAMQSVLNQAAAGTLPLVFLAEIEQARRSDPNGDIFTAILEANKRIQAQQVATPPPPEQGQVAPPETAPGLAGQPGPAVGSELQPVTTAQPGQPTLVPDRSIGPTPGMEGLRELMNAIRATSGGQ